MKEYIRQIIKNRVDYSCEGNTCFVEFDEKQIS